MSPPMSAQQFIDCLRHEGLTVVEIGDWRNHNRNSKGAWGPMYGVMIHHTVTSGTANTVKLCYDGHPDLPGPLCHGVIGKDGKVYLVGYGRANHAGLGDDDVLTAVMNETALPTDNEANTDGNSHFYGFECENLGDGKDPWPAAQLMAIEKASAAICRFHSWTQRSVIGHKEWQPGKIDPLGFTMDNMRDRIKDRLAPTPIPTPPEDDVLTTEQASQLNTLYNLRAKGPWTYKGAGTADAWALLNGLVAQVAGLQGAVSALAKAVADNNDDVDTATVVAAVEKAIADAVVQVNVNVTGDETP